MRILIIGGGAAGASCAARLRRLNEDAEIMIIEKTNEISIANCGLPYYVSGVIGNRDNILVSSPEKFKNWFNIDVKLNSEIVRINRGEKSIELAGGEKLSYDKLVLAQGASPIVPNFEGMDAKKVFAVRTLSDADKIKEYIKNNGVKKASVVGGGFIGIEMAENLSELGVETTLIELGSQILAPVDSEVAKLAQNEMESNGVELILLDGVKSFAGNRLILNSGREVEYDIVIMAIGVRPEINLAKDAGLEVGRGIIVNSNMQTADENIYAAGDSVEVKDFVFETNTLIPLAGPANKQGRIIADNICGINSTYKNSQGTSVIKVFNLTVASVGNNEKQLISKQVPYWKTYVYSRSHAGYYPDSSLILLKLLFNSEGKIYGAQAVGEDRVEKRIDVISSIMRLGGSVQSLLDSELCYAPPYSSAKDPVNILGMSADNILRGLVKPAYFEDLEGSYLIDVRPSVAYNTNTIPKAINIPINEIRGRLEEIPQDKKVVLFCNTGYTSYVASRILIQKGFNNVYSLMGGFEFYRELTKKDIRKKEIKQDISMQVLRSNVTLIDASGLQCPGPIMKVAESLERAEEGLMFDVISTDKGFREDIAAWCDKTGNSLVDIKTEDKKIIATILKGSKPIKREVEKDGQTIVVFSNDLDKVIASFIIANGARAMGKEVTMFFTFWGLNVLRKSNIKVKKGLIEKMFGFMMPEGAGKLTLSKLNMFGLGSQLMKYIMKKKNVTSLPELINQAKSNGVKFIACNMSMDVMGIKPEELIDGVEIAGVAKYISQTDTANSNLFI